ncbi:MAG: hypothetical protein HUJ69_04490 [Lachnospiraceae bacterium]|nr:hypothetical protein [Lachnospiraceae bacterium]
MIWFSIICVLMVSFFLLKNIICLSSYKSYKEKAIFVFDDTRKSFKVSRIIFGILMAGLSLFTLISLFMPWSFDLSGYLCLIGLIEFCMLFSLFPYSQSRWVVTPEGIFVYNYNVFIKWSEMVSTHPVGDKKRSFLLIELLGSEGNKLKQTSYPVQLEAARVTEMQNMFREFIILEDKRRAKLRREADKAARNY